MLKLLLVTVLSLCSFLFFEKPGLYNTGGNEGLFSMRVVGIKRVTSAP